MMAQAEPIIPEDYDGLVILEDPALLGGPEDEEETEPPATETPATEAPSDRSSHDGTNSGSQQPTDHRANGGTDCAAGSRL